MLTSVAAALASILAVAVVALTPPVHAPVVAFFDATGPYSAGHRGIDFGASAGTVVHAPVAGTITFAGTVAGNLTLTIDAGDGVDVHLSFLDRVDVARGDTVRAGDAVGTSGAGHPGVREGPAVHLAVEVEGVYVDPLPLLARRRSVLVR